MKTTIIYEDQGVLVCRKPAGLAVQTAVSFQEDMVSELKNYLSGNGKEKNPYLGVIHRLDQPVEGLLVFAKTKAAAASLTAQLADGSLRKKYVAMIAGVPGEKQGRLVDYLKKDTKTNLSRVVTKQDKDAKRAELEYKILSGEGACALAEIEIRTGRYHQIRCQMSHFGHPLLGDVKYGSQIRGQLALCAYYLEYKNPVTGKIQKFTVKPENPAFAECLPAVP